MQLGLAFLHKSKRMRLSRQLSNFNKEYLIRTKLLNSRKKGLIRRRLMLASKPSKRPLDLDLSLITI